MIGRMRRPRDLRGAVVVVTGASSGVGSATALAFAGHGTRLVLAARDTEALHTVAARCVAAGAAVEVAPTDVRDDRAVAVLAARAVSAFGRVDVWVEAAAVLVAAPFGAEPVEEVRHLVETNVLGTTYGARAALGIFERQEEGTLILVSSLLGLLPSPLAPVYAMSKFAVRGLGLSLRQAVAGQPRVHVCLVLPGPVDTPMFQRAANHTGRELRAIPPAYAPERLAAAIVGCARRPRRQVTAGLVPRLALLGHRVAPRAVEWGVATWSASLLTRAVEAEPTSGVLFDPGSGGSTHGGWRRGRLRRRLGERFGTYLSQRGAGASSRP